MTRKRIAEIRKDIELGAFSMKQDLIECLDEIERLQEEVEILKTEKRHLVNAAVKAIEHCRK